MSMKTWWKGFKEAKPKKEFVTPIWISPALHLTEKAIQLKKEKKKLTLKELLSK